MIVFGTKTPEDAYAEINSADLQDFQRVALQRNAATYAGRVVGRLSRNFVCFREDIDPISGKLGMQQVVDTRKADVIFAEHPQQPLPTMDLYDQTAVIRMAELAERNSKPVVELVPVNTGNVSPLQETIF